MPFRIVLHEADPLTFDGQNTASPTIDGPISYSGSASDENYEISFDYNTLTVTGGYPDGSVDWNVSVNSSSVYGGTIVFNGTNQATITFTSGASESYTVYLDSGTVEATAL